MTLKFYKLDESAIIPTRGTSESVGYDLTPVRIHKISERTIFFGTGLAVIPPKGYYTEIVPRSSISKLQIGGKNVMQANSIGIVDSDYRGELIIAFRVDGDLHEATITEGAKNLLGTRIAQLLVKKAEVLDVEEVDSLDETERGAGGFGSTGTS